MKSNKIILNSWRILLIAVFILSFGQVSPVHAAGVDLYIIYFNHDGGNFVPLETGRTYTIRVHNLGDVDSSGEVTLTNTLPDGLTATGISGTGWSCTLATLTCTRSDVLPTGEAYPDITVTVSVDVDAPTSVINTATVSGGGDTEPDNNTETTTTPIDAKPDLIITGYELVDTNGDPLLTDPNPNEEFGIRVLVKNQGGEGTDGVFYRSVYVDRNPMNPALFTLNQPGEEGCLYNIVEEENDWGDYRKENFISGLPAGTTDTETIVTITDGLPSGSYQIYLYADPTCIVANESIENNNSYGPIPLTIGTSTGPADVDIKIAGILKSQHTIQPENYLLRTYPGTDGQLFVDSTNGVPIVSSIRLLYINKYGYKTLSELMGVTTPRLLDNYWMPAYIDNTLTDSQIRVTNTSTTQSTTVQVYIGGVLRGTYNLGPGVAERIRYPNISGGPVQIIGTPGVPILAGMRIIYGGVVGGSANSFDEIMAYPNTQLHNEYFFPIYFHNNANLDTEVRIGNTSTTTSSTVEVYIAGILRGTYTLPPQTNRLLTYPGTDGSLRIVGTSGVPLVASIRLLYVNKHGHKTYSELMGVPTPQLYDSYVMPVYIDNNNGGLMDSQIRFTNTSTTQSTTVEVYIGGVLRGTYTLGPSESQRVRYAGLISGPIQIIGTPGVPILAGMRIIYGGVVGGSANSFDEIMAYPTVHLDPEYWFPIYFHNNANLDTEVRIGNP